MQLINDKARARWRSHPVLTGIVVIALIAAGIVWAYVLFPASGHSDVGPPEPACPRDDVCQVTVQNWQSPQHMKNRFDNGVAGNMNDKMLPANIRVMATTRWNEIHGLAAPGVGKRFECGSHWWCIPLAVTDCAIQFLRCAGDNVGWDKMQSVAFRCGGQALFFGAAATVGGSPVAGIIGAGLGGDACMYDTIGHWYGWW